MNEQKQGMSKLDLMAFNGVNTTAVTKPSMYKNSTVTLTANPFDHINSELSDIKMILRLLLDQREIKEEKSDLIGMEDACKQIGISRSSMYKLTADKKIPFTKREGSHLLKFSRADLDNWVKETIAPNSNLVNDYLHKSLRVQKVQKN